MDLMANILRQVQLCELAAYMVEGRPGGDVTYHTAKELLDSAYGELEASLEGMERQQMLAVLDAAVNYSAVMESTAFVYGMKAGALLLERLFSREVPLF